MAEREPEPELTAEVVFARLEELRALLRLTGYLAEFRPVSEASRPVEPPDPCAPGSSASRR